MRHPESRILVSLMKSVPKFELENVFRGLGPLSRSSEASGLLYLAGG